MPKSEQQKEVGTPVPGYDREFGSRLKWIVERIGTQKKAGEIAEVKPEMIAKYIGGRAKPSFYAIRDLAKAAGKSLDWLARGEEGSIPGRDEKPVVSNHPLDLSLFSEIIRLVEQWLDDNNRSLSPDKKGEVIATLYEIAMETADDTGTPQVDPNAIGRILRLVA